MPYTKASDAPSHVPESKKAQWVKVWNSVYKQAKADGKSDKTAEGEAFKQANGVIKSDERNLSTMAKREIRTITELRAEQNGTDLILTGYAALFNSKSKDLGGFVEEIAPGAFTRSLKDNADVKATFNHDANMILGRTKSGTLTLEQDERGLKWRCMLDPEQRMHRDLHASVKRGDIDECSFAFTVTKDNQEWRAEQVGENDWQAVRRLVDVDLIDVSAVTYPAYNGTSVDARCLFPDGEVVEIRSAIEGLKAQRAEAAKVVADAQVAAAAQTEKRSRDESIEAKYWAFRCELSDGLQKAFPDHNYLYIVEIYNTHLVACSYGYNDKDEWIETNYSITYEKDGDSYKFGELKPVELDWVPSKRMAKALEETRASRQAEVRAAAATVETHAKNDAEEEDGEEEDDEEEETEENSAPAVAESDAAPAVETNSAPAVTGDAINSEEYRRAARIRAANAMCAGN